MAENEVSVYSYTPQQAQVLRLYDTYRNCLLYVKYYGHRLRTYRTVNFWMDLTTALAASSAFAGLAIMKTPVGLNTLSGILLMAAIISIVRPILKVGEKIDLYSKLHYAYSELFYRIESLTDDIRRENHFVSIHQKKAIDLVERFRELNLQNDPGEGVKQLAKYQDAVDRAIPVERLWLPGSEYDDMAITGAPASSSTATITAPAEER